MQQSAELIPGGRPRAKGPSHGILWEGGSPCLCLCGGTEAQRERSLCRVVVISQRGKAFPGELWGLCVWMPTPSTFMVSAQAIGRWQLDSQRSAWALREAAACGNGKRLCTLAQCVTQTPPPPLSELPAPSFAAHGGGHFFPPSSTRTSSQHFPGEVHRVCRYHSPGILNCCCTGTIC